MILDMHAYSLVSQLNICYVSQILCRNGQLKVVSYIIKKCHCDVNITNETKESALHLACR